MGAAEEVGMNGMVQRWRRLAWMAAAVAVLSGCQWFTLGVGRTVAPERRLQIGRASCRERV